MTPTAFEFTLTIPGDTRLVDAVRHLARQAASYAEMPAPANDQLAAAVEDAARAMVNATGTQGGLTVQFRAEAAALHVVLSCDGDVAAVTAPASNGVSLQWQREGSRHSCHIRQPLTP